MMKFTASFKIENRSQETVTTDEVTIRAENWPSAVAQASCWRHGRLRDPEIEAVDLISIITSSATL